MDRADLIYVAVRFAKTVDTTPLLRRKCRAIQRVILELEYVLEDPDFWRADLPGAEADVADLPDRELLLGTIDVAGGGWHRS